MKAMVLHARGGALTLEEVALPRVGLGEALVRVQACGAGLTVVHIQQGRLGKMTLPRIIGHEVVGEVVEIGEGVSSVQQGDKVLVYFYLTCGHCRWCNNGREDLCAHFQGFVGVHIDGGFAEYLKVPARNLVHLPPELDSAESAIIADAVSTPLHALRERARVRPPEIVLVVGAGGGVGIHAVQMAKLLGAQVIGVDVSDEKLALAKSLGADEVINARAFPAFHEEARRLTAGQGVDVVLEFVCHPDTLQASLRSLGSAGRLIVLGVSPNMSFPLDASVLVRSEIVVTGSRYVTRQELIEAVELVRQGKITPVVTRTFPLADTNRALDLVERGQMAGRAIVVVSE
jgi:propanol-preferring alcohol dehydrogenase